MLQAGIAAAAAFAVLFGACGQGGDREPAGGSDAAPNEMSSAAPAAASEAASVLPEVVQELEIDAAEYTFDISPDPSGGLAPGWTLVRLHNTGVEAHQVMFARLKDGVDLSELAAAGAGDSSGAGAIEFVDMIGGVSYIGPDHDITALVNLPEGAVIAMCYVPDADGVAHALLGMSTALTVSAAGADTRSLDPGPRDDEVRGTIELASNGYRVPDDLTTGWYHVTNTDTALHELALLGLGTPIADEEVGRLVADLAANRTPSVDLEAVGGMGAISAGFDGYLYLDLEAGDYLAVDFMPDPGDPRPHMLDGYYDTFRVA